MKRTLVFLAPALIAATCTATDSNVSDPAALRVAAETITAADMHDRIAFLASDALRGRNTPSPGLDTAALWIADELASFGAEPAGEEGWFQRYPYPAVGLSTQGVDLTVAGGATHTFNYGTDFFVRAGTSVPETAGVVYAGRELAEDADVRDRVVLVRLLGLPEQGRWGWQLDRQARSEAYQTVRRAAGLGAVAVIFALDPGVSTADIEALSAAAEAPRRTYGGTADADVPPAFYVRHDAALRMFRMAGLDAAAALGSRDVSGPMPLPGLTARLAAERAPVDDARPPNVVGVIPGSDPELRDTYVVVTAHMDHVGVGRPDETGDSIYNGADDDASGTATLIAVAEALASLETAPRRSVLFVAVSGEEKGLLGSRWFADNPTVPLESMVANVNIDMVARNAPDTIVVIGQEYSSLGPLVRQIAADNPELGLTVSEDLWPDQRFFFRSDHFNFARKEIPALFFFAGTHEDYHRPSDEVDAVDVDKAARVARLVFYLTHAIAEAPTPPAWDPEGLETVRELTSQ